MTFSHADTMRRKDREVSSPSEIMKILERAEVLHLALNDDGFPYVVPLNFGMEEIGGTLFLYMHSAAEGKKLSLIQKDSRAAFAAEVTNGLRMDAEKGSCTIAYASVMGRGTVDIVPEDKKAHALNVLMRHYRREDFPLPAAAMARTTVLRLTVTEITGKQNSPKP